MEIIEHLKLVFGTLAIYLASIAVEAIKYVAPIGLCAGLGYGVNRVWSWWRQRSGSRDGVVQLEPAKLLPWWARDMVVFAGAALAVAGACWLYR